MRVIVVVMLACCLITQGAGGTRSSARAQERGGRPARPLPIQRPGRNVMIVRGAGGKGLAQNDGVQVPEMPRPLTPGEKLSLATGGITNFITSQPWTLNPAKPVFQNRGFLHFTNPTIVHTEINKAIAVFKGQSHFLTDLSSPYSEPEDKSVKVEIRSPAAGKHYLIDCTVNGGKIYYVRVSPGGAMQTFSGTNHIVVLYEATSNADVEIAIIAETGGYWYFYSAEITPFD